MMTLEIMREIVQHNMPYDTGFMFTFGARYNETAQYVTVWYDTIAVPYIVYNEEGARNNPNKGFITEKTKTELEFVASNLQNRVVQRHLSGILNKNKLRSSMVQQGVVEYAYDYPQGVGGNRDAYVG